jgi:hypothetical protein
MAHEQTPVGDTPAVESRVQEPTEPAYEPGAEEEWSDESELPRRPRRRLLTPVPIAVLAVLIVACGFIGGVLVEKGQTGSSSSSGGGASLASRFAALGGGSAGAGGAGGASRTGAAAAAGGGSAGGTGGGGATAGQVAYISGSTLYVTTAEGNTVKVTTSAGSTVTKTVKATVKGIHPGETVLITGAAGSGGAINAESIRVGGGGGAAGLGALLGGSGAGSGATGGGKAAGGGEPALFGKGG